MSVVWNTTENGRDCGKRVKVKAAQSCPTPCNPMDYTVHGILQARILEWIAFPGLGRSTGEGIGYPL